MAWVPWVPTEPHTFGKGKKMGKSMKNFTVVFTVEGVPGVITRSFQDWIGTTRKEAKARIIHQYGGRKVDIQDFRQTP